MFIRKIHPLFPDTILKKYIYMDDEKFNHGGEKSIFSINNKIIHITKKKYFYTGIFIGLGLMYIYYFIYFF
jgi:hypothetical protein